MRTEWQFIKQFEDWLYHDSNFNPGDQSRIRRKLNERLDELKKGDLNGKKN